ncbi:MAG: helix-turn-helix transcriptional regulator [Dehalococcoidia bacterium]|nr:helix-turn-helix transcriptional regulator [Dehalococcoidia bacterium]
MEKSASGKWGHIRERFFNTPELENEYEHAKRRMILTRKMLMEIDAERVSAGLSKAELARRIGTSPSVVRRVFSSKSSNPTLRTILDMLYVLDIGLELEPRGRKKRSSGFSKPPYDTAQDGVSL